MSAETQAIIKTLKDEGTLIRNRGTNSIRSVKIQLDRFESVFNTISSNVAEQTKILQMQAGLAQEAIEFKKTKEQLDELNTEKQKYQPAGNESSSRETDETIDRIGDKLEGIFSLKNIALAGAGLFVGYNLLKGFIDQRTDGGFTAMEESIKNINWSGFATAFNGMIDAVLSFSQWMDGLPALLIGGGIAGVGVRSAARGIADSLLGGGGDGGNRRRGSGMLRNLRSIRVGILGAVTGLAIAYGDDVKAYLEEQMGVDHDVANTTVDAATFGLSVASIAMMFGAAGAPGLLIGAAAGLAYLIGSTAYRWIKDREAAAEADLQRRLQAVAALYPTAGEGPGSAAALSPNAPVATGAGELTYEAERRGLTTPDQLAAAAAGDTEAAAAVAAAYQQASEELSSERIGNILTTTRSQMDAIGDTLGADMNDAAKNIIIENMRTLYAPDNPVLMSTYTEMLDYFKQNILQGINPSDEMWGEIGSEYQELYNTLTNHSFRGGTRGFMDFGAGDLAVLHGREAVVPFNTAAGRFLDQYFTEQWEPKVSNTQRFQTAASGGAGGATVVISAPTTVSPVVNNVSGGKSVNQVSVRNGGGGMGGIRSNPYGIPGFAN